MPVALLTVLLAGGLLSIGLVLGLRWLEARRWRGYLVTYQLELPRRLDHDQVNDWLAALGAATRHIPVVIEVWTTPSFLEAVTSGKVGTHAITEATPR